MSDAYVMSDKTSGMNSEPDKISLLILAVRVQGCAVLLTCLCRSLHVWRDCRAAVCPAAV